MRFIRDGFCGRKATLSQQPLVWCVTAPARCHPYDVSDEQATAIRRPPRVHPYDEVSDEQLNEKRRTPRVHPYDEVSDEQLNENRRTPRIHPYDEVSDAVLEQNRLSRPARRHEYDEVDLEPGMARVKDSAE